MSPKCLRTPDAGETPLSADEIAVAVRLRLVERGPALELAMLMAVKTNQHDEADPWPAERRFIPAGLWGISKPGLRPAHPFAGLGARHV